MTRRPLGARRLLLLLLLAAGVGWRLVRYGLGFPVWGDEAGLMLNLLERRSYAELLEPLARNQVAPLGFLAAQLTVLRLGSTSEYALRAFPLLTGIAALGCFARLAWQALPPRAAVAAVGVLTASHYVTRYALDVKPYGTDLLVAAALWLLAVEWIRAPARRRWPVLLIAVAPVALALSYPAVFVAGGIGLGLLPSRLARHARPGDAALLAAYGLVVAGAFAGLMALSAGAQYAVVHRDMVAYWARGFPPADPLRLLVWLVDVHTAEMMSYPLGGKNGASALTLLVALVGVRALLRARRTTLVAVLGAAFGLTLLAAALRGYPYGGSARVAQHLAPAICLFVGAGLDRVVAALPAARRETAAGGLAIALLGLAAAGTVRDVLHPYHTRPHRELATLMAEWKRLRQADSGIWLMDPLDALPYAVQWYLLRAVDGDRGRLQGGGPAAGPLPPHREWWLVGGDPARVGDPARPPRPALAAAGYREGRASRVVLSRNPPGIPDDLVELERWERPG